MGLTLSNLAYIQVYGSLNSLGGNIFANMALASIVELFAGLFVQYIIDKIDLI